MKPALFLALCLLLTVSAGAQQPVPSHQPSRPSPRAYAVARVNGVPVMSDRLAMAVNALLPLTSFHQNVNAEKVAEIRKKALQNLVDEELQFQDAVRTGVKVPSADVEAGLERARKAYKSPQAFEEARRKSGVRIEDLRREIQRALMIRKAYDRAVMAKCQVSEADTAEFYRANPQRFVMPEQLHVFAITIGVDPGGGTKAWADGRRRADDVLKQIRAGASFQEMSRQHSTDPSKDKGGDMGLIHRGRMTDEFERATKTMKPGDVSEVIQSIYGFHVLRLAEIKPPLQRSYEEVKAQLLKDLTSTRCEEANDAWIAALRAKATVAVLNDRTNPR
jgi:peptidyl-prolyl cis-trans isomerase C